MDLRWREAINEFDFWNQKDAYGEGIFRFLDRDFHAHSLRVLNGCRTKAEPRGQGLSW
jgi:hypothetical protein